jgi:hypothetical protein
MGRQRTTACKNSLKLAEQALERVRKQETAENGLKILEDGRDKLVNMAEAIHTETEDKLEDKFVELNEILSNKG